MFAMLLLLLRVDCSGDSCPAFETSSTLEWRRRDDDPQRAYLFIDGVQAGGYDRHNDEWRGYDARSSAWGPPQRLFPESPSTAATDKSTLNFGVMRDAPSPDKHMHFINGTAVSEREAIAALAGLVDDSQRLRLTLIGPADERRRVLDDLAAHPMLADWSERLLVQSYSPDHWAVATTGFVTTGRPTIYLQSPTGQVLHRQDEYRGPERLAEALRRADPNYRSDRDPDLNRGIRLSLDWRRVPPWAWIAGAVLLLTLLRRRPSS